MRTSLLLTILIYALPVSAFGAAGETTVSREYQKGFFSVGGYYGIGAARFLNSDGSYADYRTTTYGLDLDILLWDSGGGDIRFFVGHQASDGAANQNKSDKLSTSETFAGLKFFAGRHLYLGGSLGQGSAKLKSPSRETSVDLSYDLVRATLGLNFAITESLFVALEGQFKEAPLGKAKNPDLSANSYFEGMGATLHLIWSPPSVQINYNSK